MNETVTFSMPRWVIYFLSIVLVALVVVAVDLAVVLVVRHRSKVRRRRLAVEQEQWQLVGYAGDVPDASMLADWYEASDRLRRAARDDT